MQQQSQQKFYLYIIAALSLIWMLVVTFGFERSCGANNFFHRDIQCANILGIQFGAYFDSARYYFLIFGWIPFVASLTFWLFKVIKKSNYFRFAPFALATILIGIWLLLIAMTSSHNCAFGFGGMSCYGFWENFSIYLLILGWIPAAIALLWGFVSLVNTNRW